MEELKRIFQSIDNDTFTQNGDKAFKSTLDPLVDILFKTEYLRNHTDEISIGDSDTEKLFSMMIRDPRFGLGQRNVGNRLMRLSGCSIPMFMTAGRADDLWKTFYKTERWNEVMDYLFQECSNDNKLVKKWMPRYPKHNILKNRDNTPILDEEGKKTRCPFTGHQEVALLTARDIASYFKMNKQQYGKFIKTEQTAEYILSHHDEDAIIFEHVPSLAHIKYTPTFARNEKLKERYAQYLEDVRSGKTKINSAVSTVYDIYKNRNKDGFDSDMWFSQLEKISGSFLPVIDMSGSMSFPENHDALGKALSVGLYLSRCSTYCKNMFMTFSDEPQLVDIGERNFNDAIDFTHRRDHIGYNTNLKKVMDVLSRLQTEFPEWVVVLSDMNFDEGSRDSIEALMSNWRSRGIQSKLIWWNLSSMNAVCPETVAGGNIFMSGYSPMLLKFLKAGFNAKEFLNELLSGYAQNLIKANA